MGADQRPRANRALIAVALLCARLAGAEAPSPSTPETAPEESLATPEQEPNQSIERPEGAPETPPEVVQKMGKDVGEQTGLNFVPIPEIILDPNEGNTYGVMGVWLVTDQNDEIRYMFAPDVRYNDTKGVFPALRLFGYPSETRRYQLSAGKSTTKDESYEAEYTDRGLLDEKAFVYADLSYERDSTERFYGFGNESDEDAESNYTSQDFVGEFAPGYWIVPSVNVSYRMRIRRFNVQAGQVSSLPFIAVEHPEVRGRGLESGVYWQHRLAVTYDTRDSIDMPTRGGYANFYVDGADRQVGSSTSFVAFGLEGKDFIPFRGERRNPILALRAQLDYVQGGTDTPFWLMNSLGGRRRLRGYGGDRFIDFNRSLIGAELRTRVYEHKLFGVNAQLEVAPFVETGQVFHHIYDSPLNDLHWVGGLGFRGIVRPQIVGFVDIGYGAEGSAIFTGVDYPF
jgi:hypothetical protein